MEIIDSIGFKDVSIEFKIAGKSFNVTADPPIEAYWKLINSIQKDKKGVEDIDKLKDYIIDFIVDSHYSRLSPIKKIGKFFDKKFLKKNLGFIGLTNFINQYFKILKENGVSKNVQSPQTKKK